MAVKIKFARPSIRGKKDLIRTILLIAGGTVLLVFLVCASVFGFYYSKYKRVVDERLTKPLFENTAQIYAAPREVRVGQKLTARSVAMELGQAGYHENSQFSSSPMGTFSMGEDSITIHPGPQSYHAQDGATISFSSGKVSQLAGDSGQELGAYELEPVLITGLSEDKDRTKRRLITYDELPRDLVPAVLAIEDRRFFEHGGVNYYSMAGWVWHDMRHDRRFSGGGSTLTMQLAKMVFLTPEKTFKRKFIQIVITFQLEHRYSKKKIFEMYANQINLGQRGSFSINGFGEAAQAYFGKDVHQLNLPECALLAGMIQRPNYFSPYRHPERAVERRNLVLDSMIETGSITKAQGEAAKAAPLKLAPASVDASEAPYFVDLVSDQLRQKLGETDFNNSGLRIYTSLDPDLQQAAADAVEIGMKNVDEQIVRKHTRKAKDGTVTTVGTITYPQVALIALNPHTGQVLALVGGRNYGNSQLNHAVSKRPTGSIFKPFVYATAFNSSLSGAPLPGQEGIFTPATILNDQQTTYTVGDQEYTPRNYHADYHDEVTARYALMMSLNNATISLAEMVGFNNVASLARDAGIKSARGTPAVALGAYDATPLDMAGAYTVFANGGVKIDPWMLASVRSQGGDVMNDYSPDSKPILDPRVAYLTTSLMENVINNGTGFEVRRRGFTAPAAGKTGTSHDAWFAGFTSNLICVVWVGNDDYTDIKLSGTVAAAPIWTEFMKRAVQLPQYSDTKDFVPPQGVTEVRLDKVTNLLADGNCPQSYIAAFLDGTAPTDTCDHANGDQRNLFQRIFGLGEKTPPPMLPNAQRQTALPPTTAQQPLPPQPTTAQNQEPNPQPKKKKGFFSRIFGGSKDDDNRKQPPDQPAPQQQ